MRRAIVLVLLLVVARALLAQTIDTVAGGFTGDGQPGIGAFLYRPLGLARTSDGDLYVSETLNHRIRRVDARTGLIETVVGTGAAGYSGDGGPGVQARVNRPGYLTSDGAGNVYFADFDNRCVRRYEIATRKVFSAIGVCGATGGDGGDGGPASLATFAIVGGIAVSPNGDIFVGAPQSNRVRRVDASTGRIQPFAGSGQRGDEGDGVPALSAKLDTPDSLGTDAQGNLYICDLANNRVKVVEARTGLLRVFAGTGRIGQSGDGGPARNAMLRAVRAVAARGANEILIADEPLVRVVNLTTGIIDTLFGGGTDLGESVPGREAKLGPPGGLAADPDTNVFYAEDAPFGKIRRFRAADARMETVIGGIGARGDGGPATSALIFRPHGVAFDAAGNLFVGGEDNLVRRVDRSGRISTIVGAGATFKVDVPGSETSADSVVGFAFDRQGGLLFVEASFGTVRRWDPETRMVTLVAGTYGVRGFAGDGDQATRARFAGPSGIAADGAGNVYVADTSNHRIRRIDPSGIVTTIGGTGRLESTGDGGPASAASFFFPSDLAFDSRGRLLVSEIYRVRAIDLVSGTVSAFAGLNRSGFSGDGGPATAALFDVPAGLAADAAGNVYIADSNNDAVRVVDAQGTIRTLNLPQLFTYYGDGGPVKDAPLYWPLGLALDATGALHIADRFNNRIRKVYACVSLGDFRVEPPPASSPAGQAAPTLGWTASSEAFRYDVFLDTVNPPEREVAKDLAGTSFQAAGLLPGTTYHVKVIAKGDPYCPTVATRAASASFTTPEACSRPGTFSRTSPPDGESGAGPTPTLSWGAASGASAYDVYLGPASPPPLIAAEVATTSFTTRALTAGTAYSWRVVAKAACDATRVTSTTEGRFTVAGSCAAPEPFALIAPADRAGGQPRNVTLSWNGALGATSYDVEVGVASTPIATGLVATGLTATSYRLTGLGAGVTVTWRVVAHAGCDPSRTTSSGPFTFQTGLASCQTPGPTRFELKPEGTVTVGQSYVVAWAASDGVDGGFYRVERSLDPSFGGGSPGAILDSLDTTGRSAAFMAGAPGTIYHRVTPHAVCVAGPASETVGVAVSAARPRLVVTRQPEPVLVPRGSTLAPLRTTFEISNLGKTDFTGTFQTFQPIPFFRPTEPGIALRAGETKTFTLEYRGVPTSAVNRFHGLLTLKAEGEPLDVAPYATVALSITPEPTGEPANAAPVFGAESVSFAPTSLAADPPPITVTLRNPAATPMALSYEIGPEVWLTPDADWNRTPLAPGETRTISLLSQRIFGASGGVFPRYTYLTVRTTEGATARLLVRDEVPPDDNLCEARSRLGPGAPSLVVPSLVKATSQLGNTFVSRLSIGNLGSDDATVDLFYTPDGADGFDCARVLAKRLVVTAGDVLALTDPLATIFGVTGSGQLEIRSARLAQLSVTGSVEAPARNGGAFGFAMPAVPRGTGATAGVPTLATGLASDGRYRSNLILAETTGDEETAVRVTLLDADGAPLGQPSTRTLRPYGKTQLALSEIAGGAPFSGASATVETISGRGAVQALATVVDNSNDDAAAYAARPFGASAPAPTARRGTRRAGRDTLATGVPLTIPAVVNGYASTRIPGAPWTFQTSLSITNGTASPATLRLTYRPIERGSPALVADLEIRGRGTRSFANALVELFGIGAAERSNGPVTIEGDTSRVVVSARVFSETDAGTLGDSLPVVPVTTEKATGGRNAVTLEVEGLEHSIDVSRGVRSNVILTELLGKPAVVIVELWEKGDRRVPISSRVVEVGAGEKVQLTPVFLGESSAKDRTNVRLTVRADPSSAGKVVAMVTRIDNKTGDTKNALLAPVGGVVDPGTVGF